MATKHHRWFEQNTQTAPRVSTYKWKSGRGYLRVGIPDDLEIVLCSGLNCGLEKVNVERFPMLGEMCRCPVVYASW